MQPEPVEKLRAFWLNPKEGNRPEDYAGAPPERSAFLLELVDGLKPRPQSTLEVGCNSGRNLYSLSEVGYTGLAGVDLLDCDAAVRELFPGLLNKVQFAWGPAEDILPDVPCLSFDLVFTMAVLAHIPQAQTVAACMASIAKCYIITVEDEHRGWPINHARVYKSMFEGLGFKQVQAIFKPNAGEGVDDCFVARVFRRRM